MLGRQGTTSDRLDLSLFIVLTVFVLHAASLRVPCPPLSRFPARAITVSVSPVTPCTAAFNWRSSLSALWPFLYYRLFVFLETFSVTTVDLALSLPFRSISVMPKKRSTSPLSLSPPGYWEVVGSSSTCCVCVRRRIRFARSLPPPCPFFFMLPKQIRH